MFKHLKACKYTEFCSLGLVSERDVAIDAELKRQLPSVDVWNGRLSAIPPETAIS
jgi:hypothetical protein